MLRIFVFVLALMIPAVLVGPVMAQSPSPTVTPTTTPTPTPPAVPDAGAFRDTLLTIALGNLNAQESPAFNGFFPDWRITYPGLGGDGSAVASVPGRVSTLRNLLQPKDVASPANPTVIAFAVRGSDGACAGAVIYGFPKTDKSAVITVSGACTAQSVVSQFGSSFTATPPAAATTAAPAPPATGNALDARRDTLPFELGAGVLLVVIGLGALVLTRRSHA